MYNNPYFGTAYNPQASIDRINNQIAELEKMKSQIPQMPQTPMSQPTNLTQNFQLAPNNLNSMKYVTSIDDVNKELVFGDTAFFSKDLSVLWIKNIKGEVKSYELKEIIKKDEKDIIIDNLQLQILELKKEIDGNARTDNTDIIKSVKNEEPSNVSNVRTSKTKQKQS